MTQSEGSLPRSAGGLLVLLLIAFGVFLAAMLFSLHLSVEKSDDMSAMRQSKELHLAISNVLDDVAQAPARARRIHTHHSGRGARHRPCHDRPTASRRERHARRTVSAQPGHADNRVTESARQRPVHRWRFFARVLPGQPDRRAPLPSRARPPCAGRRARGAPPVLRRHLARLPDVAAGSARFRTLARHAARRCRHARRHAHSGGVAGTAHLPASAPTAGAPLRPAQGPCGTEGERSARPPSCLSRRADRPAKPRVFRHLCRSGFGPPAARCKLRGAAAGSGPFQAGQRHMGPCRGRCAHPGVHPTRQACRRPGRLGRAPGR